jgi:hypothetical protein
MHAAYRLNHLLVAKPDARNSAGYVPKPINFLSDRKEQSLYPHLQKYRLLCSSFHSPSHVATPL